jgi:hypothetical protein
MDIVYTVYCRCYCSTASHLRCTLFSLISKEHEKEFAVYFYREKKGIFILGKNWDMNKLVQQEYLRKNTLKNYGDFRERGMWNEGKRGKGEGEVEGRWGK